MVEDYYKLFGIAQNASEKEIKKAFRKLAHLYHPDKSKEPNATERFQEIRTAFSILSDPYSRSIYDSVLFDQESLHEYEKIKKMTAEKSAYKRKKPFWTILGLHIAANPNAFFYLMVLMLGIVFTVTKYIDTIADEWIPTTAFYESHVTNDRFRNKVVEYFILKKYVYYAGNQNYKISLEEIIDNQDLALSYIPAKQIELFYNVQDPNKYIFTIEKPLPFPVLLVILFSLAIGIIVFYWMIRISYKYYYE